MKSVLRMLLVAGVFALSLATFPDEARAEEVLSSWYGPGLEGHLTASGEIFNPNYEYTAALLIYPWAPSSRSAMRHARSSGSTTGVRTSGGGILTSRRWRPRRSV